MDLNTPPQIYDWCGKFLRALKSGTFGFEVVAHNLMGHMMHADEVEIQSCIKRMSTELLEQYGNYLRNFLEPAADLFCNNFARKRPQSTELERAEYAITRWRQIDKLLGWHTVNHV